MKPVAEFQRISGTLFMWQDYDPAVKCDCSSTAILTPSGFVFIDPLPLAKDAMEELTGPHKIAAIVLTSANHQRESLSPEMRKGATIFAPLAAGDEVEADIRLQEGDRVADALTVIEMNGFAQGEIALAGMDSLVLGDAIINIGPAGLEFLPDKYCTNPKQARKSAQKLLEIEFDTLCMAHGTPVTSQAAKRLRALIEGNS